MNIYDSIKYAAEQGWEITFMPNQRAVYLTRTVRNEAGDGFTTYKLAETHWGENGTLFTPASALIRAIREAQSNPASNP
jgi:hypothetical protein